MKRTLKLIVLALLVVALVVTGYLSESSRPEWRKISPFTRIEISGESILVEHEEKEYELVSIEGIPTEELIAAAEKRFGRQWQKRIREDIAEVLGAAGVKESTHVDLKLRDSVSGTETTFRDVEMTEEKRAEAYQRSEGG